MEENAENVTREQLKCILSKAQEYVTLGKFGKADSLLSELKKGMKDLREPGELQIEYLAEIGKLNYRQGALQEAQQHLDAAIEKGASYDRARAYALNYRASVEWSRGMVENAKVYWLESLKIRKAIGDKQGIATSLNNLGMVCSNLGNIPKAIDYLKQAIELQREAGTVEAKSFLVITIDSMAVLYRRLGALTKAEILHQEALDLAREIGKQDGEAWCTLNLGLVAWAKGDLEKANELLSRSLPMWPKLNIRDHFYIENLTALAGVYTDLEVYENAEQMIEMAQNAADVLDSDFFQLFPTFSRAYFEQKRGNAASAKQLFEICLASARAQKNFEFTIKSLVQLAHEALFEYKLTLDESSLNLAQKLVKEILFAGIQSNMASHQVQGGIIQGMLLIAVMDYENAIEVLENALKLAEDRELPKQVLKAREEIEKAKSLRERARRLLKPTTQEEMVDEIRDYLITYQQLLKAFKT
ncbi:MAG: tetratricopeptide repeat protein [Candidatus Hodarchaeota archaeon]